MISTKNKNKSFVKIEQIIRLILLFCLFVSIAKAQTTEFTYQGRLKVNEMSPTGTYDFQLKLFNAASGGTQIGATQIINGVSVVNGIFTVRVSFGYGGAVFDGSPTFLEIAVKSPADAGFTTLEPRQPLTSAPYSIRSLQATSALSAVDSTNLGGFAASQYVRSNDTRLSDARNPLAGSPNYIQNQNSAPQPANFSISGDAVTSGTFSGNIVNAQTQFNLNNNRILSQPGANNLFVGGSSGASNTSGDSNVFVGQSAGLGNTTGRFNTFVGAAAGQSNAAGQFNTFVGGAAGASNTSGSANSFFGINAGAANSTGFQNSFFGKNAGLANTTGSNNTFVGFNAGSHNTSGSANSFFGYFSGERNTTGVFNSFYGRSAGEHNTTGNDNSFFGSFAGSANSTGINNSFFGKDSGSLNTTGIGNSFFGTSAGTSNTTGGGNTFVGNFAGANNSTGGGNTFIGDAAGGSNTNGSRITLIGSGAVATINGLYNATAIGAEAIITQSNSLVLGSVGTSSVNVGINTTAPKTKLHIVGGKIYVEANGQGVILKSPGGSCFELTVTNAGALTTAAVACP
ncbi:MAG: hypothetical protein M3209_13750 [Acidobacteriota bacterium]|nr:hypothetical protein [Acidobacteriota bacterium]